MSDMKHTPAFAADGLAYLHARPVRLRSYRTLAIHLIGCGGTGSALAPHLCRLVRVLREVGREVELIFIDGDTVERENCYRQHFTEAEVEANKATALACRYSLAWGLAIHALPRPLPEQYLAPTGATPYLPNFGHPGYRDQSRASESLHVLVGCVDNIAARRQLAQLVANPAREAPRIWWLDCGNERTSGQVIVGAAQTDAELAHAFDSPDACLTLPTLSLLHPELLQPEHGRKDARATALPEALPPGISCAHSALTNPQSLLINHIIAAHAAHMLVELLLTATLRRFATYVDLASGSARSKYNTPAVIAGAVGRDPLALFPAAALEAPPETPPAPPDQLAPRRRGRRPR